MEHIAELTLRNTTSNELAAIAAMEQGEAAATILPAPPEQHRKDYVRSDTLYESLVRGDELLGFVVLVLDPDGFSLEMRRIVVATSGQGYGTQAVRLVDGIARAHGRGRIWLDVFEENARARHVYENCGYSVFGDTELNGRRLLLYEKLLQP